jgi:hypothetical protein
VAGVERESDRWQHRTDSRFLSAIRSLPLTGNPAAHEPALPTKSAKHPNNADMGTNMYFCWLILDAAMQH